MDSYSLKIYDRWGSLIIQLNQPTESWNGTSNQKDLPNGSYQYSLNMILKDGEILEKKGKFEIIR